MKIEQIAKRRDGIARIAERYGATNIRVFGSVSRGSCHMRDDRERLLDIAEAIERIGKDGSLLESAKSDQLLLLGI